MLLARGCSAVERLLAILLNVKDRKQKRQKGSTCRKPGVMGLLCDTPLRAGQLLSACRDAWLCCRCAKGRREKQHTNGSLAPEVPS